MNTQEMTIPELEAYIREVESSLIDAKDLLLNKISIEKKESFLNNGTDPELADFYTLIVPTINEDIQTKTPSFCHNRTI